MSGEEYELIVCAPALDVSAFERATKLSLTAVGRVLEPIPDGIGVTARMNGERLAPRRGVPPLFLNMRAFLAYPMMVLQTLIFIVPITIMTLFRIPIPPDSFVGRGGHWWSYWVLRAAGVKVIVRNPERVSRTESRVYVSNHVSWFEIFALATVIDRYRFVAKKEIRRVPLFGRAAGEVAAIYIERNNRKAAFSAYEEAARAHQERPQRRRVSRGHARALVRAASVQEGPVRARDRRAGADRPAHQLGIEGSAGEGRDRDTFRHDRADLSRAGRDEGTHVRRSRRARRDRVESHRGRARAKRACRFTDQPSAETTAAQSTSEPHFNRVIHVRDRRHHRARDSG